jgi:hypothetical protein
MKSMAYNLPPAWDPGFVLPKNVQDEGLERRAFVTKWMPRGTYDDETDGTGGYVVPQYVLDEGIGQGTYTTKWQPSGTYNGGKIPHWLNQRPTVTKVAQLPGGGQQVTVQPLGDAPMEEPFETYGQRAAAAMISRVATLPQGKRQAALRSIMDHLDKSLWGRTQDIFNRYVREQKMPPANAFPLALARALSTGIAAEIINTGIRGTAPQAASLLGLGCYGSGPAMGALGDTAAVPAGCTPAPAGFTYVYGATVNGQWIPGHWQRATAGQTPQPFCPGTPPAGATTVADIVAQTGVAPVVRSHLPTYDFWVGPFGFDTAKLVPRSWGRKAGDPSVANFTEWPDIMFLSPDQNFPIPQPTLDYVRPIIPEVLQWLRTRLTEVKNAAGQTDKMVTYDGNCDDGGAGISYRCWKNTDDLQGFLENAKPWFDAMGISQSDLVRMHTLWGLKTTATTFGRTKHIKTGKDMVLNVQLIPMHWELPFDAKTNPIVLKVWLSEVPDPSIFGALWNPMNLINPLAALQATASVVAGVTNELSDLACDVLGNPMTGAAAGTVAAAYGIPPQAGTTGVAVAAQSCGHAPPAPPPVPIVKSSIWPLLLLGGGGVLAVALLASKPKPKKKAP